jgi:hypothetical protein
MITNCSAKKFGVTIATKASSLGACIGPEEAESHEDRITGEILEAKNPIVVSSPNKNETVAKAADQDAISKGNVHINKVQVEMMFLCQRATSRCLGNRGIRTQQHWKLPAINPLAIETCLNDMLVIAEATKAHSSMEFLRQPVSLSVGTVGLIAVMDGRRQRPQMMH